MDVVIISCGQNEVHRTLTQNAVNSCINSGGDFRIIVVETCNKEAKYDNCETYFFPSKDRFNYNRAMNYGARIGSGKYIACCNNDLIFHKGWSKGIETVLDNDISDSCSPFERGWHVNFKECKPHRLTEGNHVYMGNQVRVFFCGWCYVLKREAFDKIGGFNEGVQFYYSDNIVVEQYKKHGIRHALVANSCVDHYNGGENTWRKVLCKSKQR